MFVIKVLEQIYEKLDDLEETSTMNSKTLNDIQQQIKTQQLQNDNQNQLNNENFIKLPDDLKLFEQNTDNDIQQETREIQSTIPENNQLQSNEDLEFQSLLNKINELPTKQQSPVKPRKNGEENSITELKSDSDQKLGSILSELNKIIESSTKNQSTLSQNDTNGTHQQETIIVIHMQQNGT